MIRVSKRVSWIKSILLCIPIISIFLFSLSTLSFGTYSYFNAKASGYFTIKNALEHELVSITKEEVLYKEKCTAEVPVKIQNIFDYKVVILIDQKEYIIEPGKIINVNKVVARGCNDFGERKFNIVGYNNYFVHPISVIVDKDKLNPCPQPAIDNAKGTENENGLGKHCGDQGNHETEQNITSDKTQSLDEPLGEPTVGSTNPINQPEVEPNSETQIENEKKTTNDNDNNNIQDDLKDQNQESISNGK
jgi:hypothetical protein